MQRVLFLFTSLLLVSSSMACARKSMSDRDVRREQMRLNAHKKRQELTPLVGEYRGFLLDTSGLRQDVSLHLELKDVPETEEGQIDPVLVPMVNGALNLTYGSGEALELFSFATTKAEYDAASAKLDLLVTNTQLKDMNVSLEFEDDRLVGSWSSTSTSTSGNIEFVRSASLSLGGEIPQIKGVYQGVLEWQKQPFFARSALTISTARDGVDSFHISANLRITFPSTNGDENFLYDFNAVEFNPLSRQLSLKSDNAELYFIGQLQKGEIVGSWYSKTIGLLGSFSFSSKDVPLPVGKSQVVGASGTWYASITNITATAQLPERLMLSFNAVPNGTGGLSLAGSARFYLGSYSSNEFIEYPLETVDYLPYLRRVVAVTRGTPKLTIQLDLTGIDGSGRINDSSLGEVAVFTASREKPPQSALSQDVVGQDAKIKDDIGPGEALEGVNHAL